MAERELTPELARELFSPRQPTEEAEPTEEPTKPDEQKEPEPLDADARKIAEAVLADPDAAQLLEGETAEELLRSAHKVKQTLDRVRVARRPPVNFDGGAREPAPLPGDPEADFNSLVVDLARTRQARRGPHGWVME